MAGSPGETFFPVGRIRQNQEWELLPALGSPFLERTTLTSSPVTLHLSHQAASIPTYVEDGIQCGYWPTPFFTGNFTPKKKSYTSAFIIVYDINIVFIVNSELAIEKGKMRGSEEKIHNNRTGFWPKGWAGLQMLSQTIRLSVFGRRKRC